MTATAPRRPSVPPIQKWRQPRLRTKAEILAAALRWQEQTGTVPRYIDWHPLERAQERDWPLAGPTKWTAEFPAWPAAEQVQKLFGSWRHMYVEAGIDGLPPIELTYPERVSITLGLKAEGWTWDEIGEHLQLNRDTVRKYIHAHHCPGCGCYITARAETCHSCAPPRLPWGDPFSRDEILDAFRHWHELEGDYPLISDWRPDGHPRWLEECPRFPPVSAVVKEFGTWNAALLEAGRPEPRHRYYSNAEILELLRAYALQHGEAPTSSTWDRFPVRDIISRRFGGWVNALRAADLEPILIRRKWDDDAEILEGLRALAQHLGRLPNKDDRVGATGEFPSPYLATCRFDGFGNALRLAGLLPACPKCCAAGTEQCVDEQDHALRYPHPARRVAGGTQRPRHYKKPSSPRAAKGDNPRRILAVVADQPGITAREIIALTGLDRGVAGVTIARLRDRKRIIGTGDGWRIVPEDRP